MFAGILVASPQALRLQWCGSVQAVLGQFILLVSVIFAGSLIIAHVYHAAHAKCLNPYMYALAQVLGHTRDFCTLVLCLGCFAIMNMIAQRCWL